MCHRLLERGDDVIALSRSGSSLEDSVPTRAADLATEVVSQQWLQGVEVVFHLAGIAHRRAPEAEYEAVNHRATLQLAEAARSAGVSHFLFLSSVKAMGPADSDLPRAELNCNEPLDAYGASKWRAECDLREMCGGSDMALSILRPALVGGAGVKGNLRSLARSVARGLPRPPEGGERSMVAVDDLVDLLCLLADSPPGGVNTWIVAGETFSTRQAYDALRRAAGKSPGAAWLPAVGWRLAAVLLDLFAGGDDSHDKLFATEVYDAAAVRGATGWQPRRGIDVVAADIWRGLDR